MQLVDIATEIGVMMSLIPVQEQQPTLGGGTTTTFIFYRAPPTALWITSAETAHQPGKFASLMKGV